MTTGIPKRVIKLFSQNKNAGHAPFRAEGFHFATNRSFFLDETSRKLQFKSPNKESGDKIHVLHLTRKHVLPNDLGHQWYAEFTVYDLRPGDKLHDDPVINKVEVERNDFMLELEKCMKIHNFVSWTSPSGESLNPNCRNGHFNLVDESAIAKKQVADTTLANACTSILVDAFEKVSNGDTSEFMNMVYGLGIGSFVGVKNNDDLFNMLKFKIENNPKSFLDFVEHPDRKYDIVINKAVLAGDLVMSGEVFYLGDKIIGNGLPEAKAYLKGNQNDWAHLYSKHYQEPDGEEKKNSPKVASLKKS